MSKEEVWNRFPSIVAVQGIGLMNMEEFCLIKEKNAFSMRKEDKFREVLRHIEKTLGSRVGDIPIKPKRWQKYKPGEREYDLNIISLVEFVGRKILFIGSVSPQLYSNYE
jgi:hypothetical protein